MSIFKKHNTNADRSASDRRRHKEKIEKAIKEGIHDIVAEESIIGQSGKKKIKIPVRGIKEYQFVFGRNEGMVQVFEPTIRGQHERIWTGSRRGMRQCEGLD